MHVAAGVLLAAVVHRLVRRELGAGLDVQLALVGVQPALAGDVLADDLADRLAIGNGDVEGADVAAALDQRDDGALAAGADCRPW